jgi:cell division septum initiation protein DivIVA
MSTQVKRKAAEADEWIRQQAEAAKLADHMTAPEGEQPPVAPEVVMTPEPPVEQFEPQSLPIVSNDAEMASLREAAEKADQRWRTLQGQINSKDRQIEQLHELLGKMQSAPPVVEAPPPPQARGYTSDDVDAFGEDMIDVVERVARQIAAQQNAELQARLDALTNDVSAVTNYAAKAITQTFDESLDELSPQWKQLDTDDGFHNWLDSSPRRRQIFTEMSRARDAEGCAEYFNLYSASIGELEAITAAARQKKADQLAMQIVPGKSRTSEPPAKSTPDTGMVTKSEIAGFYAQKGKYSKEDFAKKERYYAQKMKDGRVDYTK